MVRDGAGRGHQPGRTHPRTRRDERAGSPARLRPAGRRAAARQRDGRRPPRHQTRQRADRSHRSRAIGRSGTRLRRGRPAHDAQWRHSRNTALHQPRAGARPRFGRLAFGHLVARRDAVPRARRQASVRGHQRGRDPVVGALPTDRGSAPRSAAPVEGHGARPAQVHVARSRASLPVARGPGRRPGALARTSCTDGACVDPGAGRGRSSRLVGARGLDADHRGGGFGRLLLARVDARAGSRAVERRSAFDGAREPAPQPGGRADDPGPGVPQPSVPDLGRRLCAAADGSATGSGPRAPQARSESRGGAGRADRADHE